MLKSLEELVNIIRDRKNSNSEKSYTNKLLNDKKMNVEKVNEEVKELIEAIEKNDNQVHEAADVLYHLLVYELSGEEFFLSLIVSTNCSKFLNIFII